MNEDAIIFSIFLIFTGAAVLATLALFARQSLLVAYIALGVAAGPHGLDLVPGAATVQGIGQFGIVFLLFLLGLNLPAAKLLRILREALRVTVLSTLVFWLVGAGIAITFGFGALDTFIIGAAAVFSSTIIGLKLMPTTALHHRHMGEVVISILLLQDILAVAMLVAVEAIAKRDAGASAMLMPLVGLPVIALSAWAAQRYVLVPLIARFDTIAEYVFLLAVGWCVGIAQAAHLAGLSYEMGAFIAGVVLAASPISLYIAESLKPLRDFFLVMFFFALGAGFELPKLFDVLLPACALAGAMLALKPLVFRALLAAENETTRLARETGVRLGQMSEFSLLLALLALEAALMSERAFYLVQAATLITIVVSAYWIMLRYPTPIAVDAKLRRT